MSRALSDGAHFLCRVSLASSGLNLIVAIVVTGDFQLCTCVIPSSCEGREDGTYSQSVSLAADGEMLV